MSYSRLLRHVEGNNMSMKKALDELEKTFDLKLKKQTQDGLAKVYDAAGCGGVAKEIKAGRNVTKNAEYGIHICIHSKTAPRVNPDNMKFFPQTKRGKELEGKFIDKVNEALAGGGFKKMSPSLLSDIRKKDKAFENHIKKLRGK